MVKEKSSNPIRNFFKEKVFIFLNENGKLVTQFIFTALFIFMAAWFINHEKAELSNVKNALADANIYWILVGLGLFIFYIFIQGVMYVTSFASINTRLRLWDAIILFLKRNFISVFLPAGGVTSLAFFSSEIEKKSITKTQVYLASSIYAFVGILSVVIVAIPAFLFAVTGGSTGMGKWYALAGVILILIKFIFIYYSLLKKRAIYTWFLKVFPKAVFFFEDLSNNKISRLQFVYTVLTSIVIEFVGIAHVYISMLALNFSPSLSSAIMAYIVVVLFLIISPFLRGLGAIEVSMTYVLIQSGFSYVESMAITLLFRFFEFWLPLLTGILSFLLKVEKLVMRILPAVLIFFLGILNIISVLTPALPERIQVLKDYLLVDVVSFSNSFILVAGLFLLITAAFMLRGLRTAWWFAIALSIISIFGHITKGIDYEEASIALLIVGSLLATRKEYYVKTNPKLGTVGLQTSLLSIVAVSEEWLKLTERNEIIFSQGMFVEKVIKEQTVITVENREEKIITFLNIIPDYVKNEGTYDLLRKTADAPNGIMDYILIELFSYFRTRGIQYVNLGFAPMSGMNDPHNFPEKSMKFAYEKIRSFSHYKGQREYKEKFNPQWNDKFLVYNNDYDLLQVPAVLARVIKM